MDEKSIPFAEDTKLRRHAEALLRQQQKKKKKKKTAQPQTEADTQRLLHELQVHQIELEMQNEELRNARDGLEAGLERYTDLYDFAPVGYFSLDEQGLILEVNLTGAALLGIERCRLVKRRLTRFVAPTTRPIVLALLDKVFAGPEKQICEAELLKEDGTRFWADLQGKSSSSGEGARKRCRLAVSDIYSLRRAEEAEQRIEALAALNRDLTQEIKRRERVERALQKSERHTGRLLAKSLKLQGQLRHLSHQVLRAQEDERKRISRELHDSVLQTLAGINVHLTTLKGEATINPKDLKRKISATQRLVETSVDVVHRFARDLRPSLLDDLGLIPALKSYLKEAQKRTGLPIQFTSFTHGWIEHMDTDGRTVLYRVAQEAITNVIRHAEASRVEVRLRRLKNGFCLEIIDDGKSFPAKRLSSAAKRKRLGLLCMRERVETVGGTLSIEAKPGQGTSIRAEIPFVGRIEDSRP